MIFVLHVKVLELNQEQVHLIAEDVGAQDIKQLDRDHLLFSKCVEIVMVLVK